MSDLFNSVFPVVTLLAGAAGTLVRDRFQASRETKREREARDAERDRTIRERREAFELETLTQLNDALNELGTAAADIYTHNLIGAGKSDNFPSHRAEDNKLTNAHRQANRGVRLLAVQVLDDSVRQKVLSAHAAINSVAGLHDYGPNQAQAFVSAVEMLTKTQETVGERIRDIYLSRIEEEAAEDQ